MSDSNRIIVGAKVEATAGVAPAGPYATFNLNSVSLGTQKGTAEENTIRSDRNLKGLIMTNLLPQGGFAFDYIFGNLDTLFFPGVFGSTFSTPVSLTGIAATVSGTGTVITATAGTPFSVCAAGQWLGIVVAGTTYLVQVVSVGGAGASITVTGQVIADGAVTLTTVKGSFIRNGTTMSTYTIEKSFADQATKGFFAHRGMVPNTFSINAQAEQIVTGDLQFMGMNADTPTDTSVSGAAYSAASTNESFAGLNGNFGLFSVNGVLQTSSLMAIRGVNMSLTNNVRRDAAINVALMGWGQCTVTGQMSTYFKGGMAAVDAFYSHANSSASYSMTDPAGNIVVITFLLLKWSNFTNQIGGKNQAVMGDLDFTAILHPTYNATIQVDVIPIA